MFAYLDHDSYLHRRNPVIKFVIVLVITLIVSLSYFPVLPFLTFVLAFGLIWIGGKVPMTELLRRLTGFIVVSLVFMVSMLILRGLNDEQGIVCEFLFLKWTRRDLTHAFSLGLRILALVTMSMGFVLTSKPRDIVLSLIMQCKVPDLHGYAALAAYRFLPELQSQVNQIHLAQEIRGIPWNRGVLSRVTSPFRVMLPLFCVAARRGERLANAMESRGLGRNEKRTYYTEIKIDKQDWIFLAATVLIYGVLVAVLVKLDLFHFSFAAVK